MFNEKIFVFFFFWLCFLFAGTLFSIFKWINAIASRKQFFKKLLSIAVSDKKKCKVFSRIQVHSEKTPI